ncbi:MAG: putative cytochrome assembly protein [Frankiales bacterium]|nr:putative cytochrome assembly protein [Frankiales bacterium]
MTVQALASTSDKLLFATIVVYALAMLCFAGEQAARKARAATPVLVGAGAPVRLEKAPEQQGGIGRLAVVLTAGGAVVHLVSLVLRGVAAGRPPWGNMYEFSVSVAFVAVAAFLWLVADGRVARSVGAFVMVPVVLYLGLAGTVLYTPVSPLVPALDSYWLKIHVAAAVMSSGAFLLSGVVALLYLTRARYDAAREAGSVPRFPLSLGQSLPSAPSLDRASYSVIAFAFPVWTFAIVAGAIWAEAAWGRYWGWDPKETWSFITWVLYAGYLHARATAGWKGRKAAWVAVAAACALVIDYYVVNIFVVGLHSYADV